MRKDRYDRNGERGSEEKNGVDTHHSYKNSTQISMDICTNQNMVHGDPKEGNRSRNGKTSKSNFFGIFYVLVIGIFGVLWATRISYH